MQINTATLTWFTNNYGSIFQAFALQNALMKYGICNEIINYRPNAKEKVRFFLSSQARWDILKNKIENIRIKKYYSADEEKEKRILFCKFERDYLNLTNVFCTQKELNSISSIYDAYICGSDQIWNPAYFKKCNFLSFVSDDKRKISYAASIGKSKLSNVEKRKIRPLLKSFDYISVREKTGVKLIQPLVNSPVSVVCDPVFLLTKEEYRTKLNLQTKENDYILCYYLGDNPEYIVIADKMSSLLGVEIKTIPTNYWGWSKGKGVDKIIGPKEWLEYIYNSKLILTDSFHAMAFSILFNKSFFIFKRFLDNSKKSQNSRIEDLAYLLGLENRIIDNNHSFNKAALLIDSTKWRTINKEILKYRNDSQKWLLESLAVKDSSNIQNFTVIN